MTTGAVIFGHTSVIVVVVVLSTEDRFVGASQ
jgi:hypothetical protein